MPQAHEMRLPDFGVLIRAHNEEQHIGRLLAGIMEQTVRPSEILLVDSGSTDATLAIAARFPVEVIHIQREEFSFGRSLNRGCDRLRGDAIVLASAHVYPRYRDWLEQLLAPLGDPRVAMTYGKQRGDRGSRFSEERILQRWFPEQSNPSQDEPFCNNANAAIRRELWKTHPYDEDLPGLEDVAWASWAIGQGYRLAYVAEAEVVHVHNESPRQVFNRYRREAMAMRRIRPHEQFRFIDFVRLFSANVFSDLVSGWRMGRLPSKASEILWFRWMQLWGTYRGYSLGGPLTSALKRTFYYPNESGGNAQSSLRDVEPIDYGSLESHSRERSER